MEFSLEILRDPTVYQRNRLPAHSDHVPLDERGEPLALDLSGEWLFQYAQCPEEAPEDFFREDCDLKTFETIQVPGEIQLQGWGKPHYVNTQYPWDGHERPVPGEIPQRFNPTGCYVKVFDLPPRFEGGEIRVRFEGVETGFALWLNGRFVGYSEDSFTPAEFDLTPYARPKDNRLAVEVFRFCSGSWLEDQDFWRFSGIFRKVSLLKIPETHVEDLKADARLLEGDRQGLLSLDLKLHGALQGQVELELGENLITAEILGESVHLEAEISAPRLWSAEHPELYHYALTVRSPHGKVLEVIRQHAGFRRFALEDGLMKLNGKRLVFKGVNRHEWNCRSGRAITLEDIRWDLTSLKQHNVNAIRTCHYPNRSEFYDLCDRMGFYVIDETNLETHGTWQKMGRNAPDQHVLPGDHPLWRDAVLDRGNSMLERDKNHPCVLIWSCGNESHGGKTLFELSQFFREKDPTRLVHYEGIFHDRTYPGTSDMESQMYTPAAKVEEFLEEHPEKPMLLCEYSHAMGNSLGGMSRYTELTERLPRYQGGFLWDFIDQGLLVETPQGKDFAYGGDFGDRPTDYNFCCDGIVTADRKLSPKMQEVKFLYQNFTLTPTENSVRIHNKSLFTDAGEYLLRVTLWREGSCLQTADLAASAAPGGRAEIPLPFPVPGDGEYVVRACLLTRGETPWAPQGHEVAWGETVFGQRLREECRLPLEATLGDVNLGVRGRDFEALFDRNGKGLVSYRYGGREYIQDRPRLSLWRAPTDNDRGWNMPFLYAPWSAAGRYAGITGMEWELEPDRVTVTYRYELANAQRDPVIVRYRVTGDGGVEVELTWEGPRTPQVPEFGLMLFLPGDCRTVEYYGLGPEENYCDRREGARLGRYTRTAEENLSPYSTPQECGSRCGVRWAKVLDESGRGLRLEGDGMVLNFLSYTPEELEAAPHRRELPHSERTVVRCLLGQMGVAGDNSWGATPHPEDLLTLTPGEKFVFRFQGI